MNLFEKYLTRLDKARADRLNWKRDFGWKAKDGKSLERLRLAAALYNDLRAGDHDLVRFLFTEEVKQKKWYREHDTEATCLLGLMLTKFSDADDLPILCEAHKLDSDFDIKVVLSMGVHVVSYYVDTAPANDHTKLLKEALEKFSADDVRKFRVKEESTFAEYKFKSGSEIHVASLLEETAELVEMLQEWLSHRRGSWTEHEAQLYAYYSSGTILEIPAFEFYVSHFNTAATSVFTSRLKDIYLERGECNKAIELLCSFLAKHESLNKDILYSCIRDLCDLLIYHEAQCPDANKAFNLIRAIINQSNISSHEPVQFAIERLVKEYPGQF